MFLHVSVILSTEGSLHDVISCLAAWSHFPSRGSLSPVSWSFWGSLSRGSLSRGLFFRGVSVQGDLCLRGSLSREGLCRETLQDQKSRWYTSYWNAFLFIISLCPKFRGWGPRPRNPVSATDFRIRTTISDSTDIHDITQCGSNAVKW